MPRCLPERGRIGIFNRSYYEEVLIVRVHQDIKQQRIPPQFVGKRIWDERLADIAHFEDYLTRQGTIILKFFLHVSRKEQKKRFRSNGEQRTHFIQRRGVDLTALRRTRRPAPAAAEFVVRLADDVHFNPYLTP
jgi:polyphosphate kinase 2 (PPK2 family)